jgi:hypothetical protein
MKSMRNSISIGNESKPANNINFENLVQAKGVIISISNELEFHQKQTLTFSFTTGMKSLKCAIQAGESI